MRLRPSLILAALVLLAPAARCAWDYEGHRIVNQLALASLPKDFPAFVHKAANAERIAFLAEFAAGRLAHLDKFPDIDQTKNLDRTREWCAFAPWAITEYFGKMRSS